MSGRKFNRRYIFQIETASNEWIEIKYPLTIEFSLVRTNLGSANTANFTIYNLNSTTRSKIYKDLVTVLNSEMIRNVQFYAGYVDGPTDLLPRIFNGTLKRAFHYRQNANYVTEIEAYDGAISSQERHLSFEFPARTDMKTIVMTTAKQMSGVKSVTFSENLNWVTNRGMSVMGEPWDIISQLTGNQAYIDSGNLYVIDTKDVLLGDIRKIDATNGLLETPRKGEAFVDIEMLFEPRIKPNQLIELSSKTEDRFNGVYRVTGIKHRGVISDTMGGECRTSLTMALMQDYKVIYDAATNEWKAE